MRQLTIDVHPDVVDRVSRLFPGKPDAAAAVATIALSEYADWLTGNRRPGTLSEQIAERVLAIFSEIVTDEVPDTSYLVNTLGLSLGQARHVIQTLNVKESVVLRKRALLQLMRTVEEWRTRIKDYDDTIKKGTRIDRAPIRVPNALESLFKDVYFEMCRENDDVPPPDRARNLGSEAEYRMDVVDWPVMLSKLDERLTTLS